MCNGAIEDVNGFLDRRRLLRIPGHDGRRITATATSLTSDSRSAGDISGDESIAAIGGYATTTFRLHSRVWTRKSSWEVTQPQ